jgi:hypothetical protein
MVNLALREYAARHQRIAALDHGRLEATPPPQQPPTVSHNAR